MTATSELSAKPTAPLPRPTEGEAFSQTTGDSATPTPTPTPASHNIPAEDVEFPLVKVPTSWALANDRPQSWPFGDTTFITERTADPSERNQRVDRGPSRAVNGSGVSHAGGSGGTTRL